MHSIQFTCPYCQSPLSPDTKTWVCDGSLHHKNTKHPFDVARQGYINLLPVQNKKSKIPGDSQESIDARHRFLSQGFYQPLQQLISELVSKDNIAGNPQRYWLDVGCGEGYYTQAIARSCHYSGLIALDISKPAVTTVAKIAKQKQQLWYQVESTSVQPETHTLTAVYPMVASASRLPLVDASIDGISTIFSPILPTEFARVLDKGGRLIIAKPNTGHLQTVRQALFDEVCQHDSDKFLDELAEYFTLKRSHYVQCEMSLNQTSLSDLLTMTPYSYRAKVAKREALLALADRQEFQTQAKFVVYELMRL